ncbi:MAG: peptide ABC transporter substrate-binding protein [Gemmatimonadaceae bacterium]|nr:peptide ABC transporter substrate-binding protein [Gemmatimonadaceae bacterium]
MPIVLRPSRQPRIATPVVSRRRARSLLAAAAGLLTACSGGDPVVTGETGGTMVIVQAAEPQTLFPPRANGTQEMAVVASVFDRLAEIGPELGTVGDVGFVPRLASSWHWAPDSLSIDFSLDPRARWHDGAPVRAEDVKYTFHAYTSDAVLSEARSLLGNIDSVSVRDSLTAVVWFKRRTPQQFMDATYSMFILPSHLLASLPDSALLNAPFGRQPVGTGRFRFAKWDAGTRLEIVADTANLRGRAKLDRVIWTFVSDMGAATVKLLAGEADFLEKIKPENIPQVASSPSLRLEDNRPLGYGFLGFNLQARRSVANGAPLPHPVFGDLRVRRALAMALDRSRMIRSALDSLGMVGLAPAPRVLIPDTSALRAIPYDMAAARGMLDSAGWMDTNGDGVREHEGQALAFELLVPSSSPTRMKLSELIQAALKEVGAKVTLQPLDGPTALGPRLEARDFDAWMGGWAPNPGLQGMRQTWASRGDGNYQSYVSPAFDALMDSALTTFDASRSRGYWTRAFQQAIDDVPSVWLYEERTFVVLHRRIRIAPLRADAWYANLADWSVDPAQRIDRDRIGVGTAR